MNSLLPTGGRIVVGHIGIAAMAEQWGGFPILGIGYLNPSLTDWAICGIIIIMDTASGNKLGLYQELNEITKAYLAGCMDCDGCFQIKLKGWKGYKHHHARVSLWQTSALIPLLLAYHFGGVVKKHIRKGPARDVYSWDVTYTKAVALCRLLLPYLYLKHRQAEILLELQATMAVNNYGRNKLPESTWQLRQKLHSEIALLNKRGK